MRAKSLTAFRIARETRAYKTDDVSGAGAASCGGRWNHQQTPMVYASLSRALAVLETMVHIREPRSSKLPMDCYLVEIIIPQVAWHAREVFDPVAHVAWDSIPGSKTAADWGTVWVREQRSLVAVVPSVVVPEEHNVLLNPQHRHAHTIRASIIRKWVYDSRLFGDRHS